MIPEEKFMRRALELANEKNNTFAAVVVCNGKVVGEGINLTSAESDPTLHAEIVAIRDATKNLKQKYLNNCVLYSTVEPCSMCTSAAIWAQMEGIVYAASLEDASNHHTQLNIHCREIADKSEQKLEVIGGFLAEGVVFGMPKRGSGQ